MSDTANGFRQVRETLEANNQIITFEGVRHYIVGIEDYETSLATITRLEAEHAEREAECAAMRKEIERHITREWFECQAVFGSEERRREAMDRRMAEYGQAGRDLLAERDQLAARVAELEADVKLWKPMTNEEAQKAYDEAEAMPLSEERINEIVDFALDPANRIDNSKEAQLVAKIRKLAARCKAMEGVVEAAKAWLTATRSSNPPQGASHLAGIMFAVDALAVVPPTC